MHTPGPWVTVEQLTENDLFDVTGGSKNRYVLEDFLAAKEEDKANLNLIAAAPELLEAVEILFPFAQAHGFQNPKVLAAIKKAKGES